MSTEVQATPWVVRYAKLRNEVDTIVARGKEKYLSAEDQLMLIDLQHQVNALQNEMECDHTLCVRTYEMPRPFWDNPFTGEKRGSQGSSTHRICEIEHLGTQLSNDLFDVRTAIWDSVDWHLVERDEDGAVMWEDSNWVNQRPYVPGQATPDEVPLSPAAFLQEATRHNTRDTPDDEMKQLATRERVQDARRQVEKAARARKNARAKARKRRRKANRRGIARRIWTGVKSVGRKLFDKATRVWRMTANVTKKALIVAKKALVKAKQIYQRVRPYVEPALDFVIGIGRAAEKVGLFKWLAKAGRFASKLRVFVPFLPAF